MVYIPKKRAKDDVEWGVFLWEKPDGSYISDSGGNYLSVGPVLPTNTKALSNLKRAAAECGVVGGKAVFLRGFRKISDAEYELQVERLTNGEIPDEVEAYRQVMNGLS